MGTVSHRGNSSTLTVMSPMFVLLMLQLVKITTSLSCMRCCDEQEQTGYSDHGDDHHHSIEVLGLHGQHKDHVENLDCTVCTRKYPEDCTSGQLTWDVCGCCQVCAKAEGDVCGGPWGIRGTCADFLFCDLNLEEIHDEFNADGICRVEPLDHNHTIDILGVDGHHIDHTQDCCENLVAKSNGDVFKLDNKRGLKKHCVHGCLYRREGDVNNEGSCLEVSEKFKCQ